ncbi:MAG: ABC-2 transporter permease [Vallitaleaceae bacterium]|jgi:ABC-2 type transport system permease protein|nr:ABC-2 transporter permease [Vallitaleaceae bacterium]
MKNLLYKEFKLAINPFFYVLPVLTGALMLIPYWLYFFVFLYFCFISAPNAFAFFKSQNDLMFSIMLPVRKQDIVKARILSFVGLEMLHIVIAIVYALINRQLYDYTYYLFLVPNAAFFGLVFVMFGIFNIVLFPMFYKTGYLYGAPMIVSTALAVIFAAGVELLGIYNDTIHGYLKGTVANSTVIQISILGGGIFIYVITAIIAYRLSIKRFERVDI